MRKIPSLIAGLSENILKGDPLHQGFLNASLSAIPDDAMESLDEYLVYCTRSGRSIEYLADCYNTIVNDTRSEQFFFSKHGRYRYSRYREVADNVYFDPAYMTKYMYGLALTAFLWPNHARLYDFFVRTFPAGKSGSYLEVGPGHGYYLRQAAKLGDFSVLTGVDISPTSVAMTRDILAGSNLPDTSKVSIVQEDFLTFQAARPFDCIVMGEVLEHVETPNRFLQKIAELSHRGTHTFVTTCINAPAVDHIYLFRTTDEVEILFREARLDIVEKCYVPMVGKTLEECRHLALPINVAYALRKQC